MEDMKQDDIEGALTDHHKDLQRVDNGSETNEEMTLTNWGHYVDVIWELKDTLPGYDERELYRNHIRGLPREEFAEAVKRLHNDLREWDKDKMNDATPEQFREMAKAWLQKKEDIKEEKHRPLEEEGEHTIYPASGMTKYMNIMRDLNAVKTEREEVRVGGETYDDKKREEEGKEEEEEEQEEKKEAAPPNEDKDDEREERTKINPTTLVNDGRTDLNESGKEATRKEEENARKRKVEEEKARRENDRRHV